MSRYIDADAMKQLLDMETLDGQRIAFFIDEQPTADVKPVVRGEWIWQTKTETRTYGWKCSACNIAYHTNVPYFGEFNYCPSCGARMVEE